MRIAFCGPSGSGKTTLASYVAERYGLELCPVGARLVASSMGYASPYDVDAAGKRGEFQTALLKAKRAWERDRESFVTDRTTLDNLAYATMHSSVTDLYLAAAADGMRRYTHVVRCPLSAFCDLAGDPARRRDEAYHQLYDAVLDGFLLRWGPATLTLWESDLDARKRKIDALF